MRILAITHQPDAGPGVFADEIRARRDELDEWRIAAGEPAPAEPAGYDAVLSFGGSMHADRESQHPWLAEEKALLGELARDSVPLLGVCLGSQLLAEALGAPAAPAPEPEIGWRTVEVTSDGAADPLIGALAPRFDAFQWHRYRSPLPSGAVALAESPASLQAFRAGERTWGIQFHAEVTERDAIGWVAKHRERDDEPRLYLDELAGSIREQLSAWNEAGRALCGRFLEEASRR